MTSQIIQARLHPDVEGEDVALAVFDDWKKAGHAPREILKNALIALGGYPVHEPESMTAIRYMLEGLQEALVDTVGTLLDEKMDELAAMTPTERRKHVRSAARSSFGNSILQSVDVADYEGDD